MENAKRLKTGLSSESTGPAQFSPSQGFLSAAHDLCRKYLSEVIYYNDKTYVKLWLLFAAYVSHWKGELDLSIKLPGGRPEAITPGIIYEHMFAMKIGKYLSLFYLTAANYFESIQE